MNKGVNSSKFLTLVLKLIKLTVVMCLIAFSSNAY